MGVPAGDMSTAVPATGDQSPWHPRRLAAGFGIGFLAALVLIGLTIRTARVPEPGPSAPIGYVSTFSPARSGFTVLLIHGDGQAYGQIARDPLLQDVAPWASRAQFAFFAQRPLTSYLVWAGSGGDPRHLEFGFVLVEAAAAGLLVAGAMAMAEARRRNQDEWWALLVLALPPVLVSLTAFGPDLLGPALAVTGLAIWLGSPTRRWWAVALFVAAALSRESTLVVPLVVSLDALVRTRRVRTLALVAAPAAAYLLWAAVVRLRIGASADGTAKRSSFGLPPGNIRHGIQSWQPSDAVVLVGLFGALVVIGLRHRREIEGVIVLAYVAASLVLNRVLWSTWTDMGRVMVPPAVLAVVLLLPRRDRGASHEVPPRVVVPPGAGGTTNVPPWPT